MSRVLNKSRSALVCSIKSPHQINELWISDYGSFIAVCLTDRRSYEWILAKPQNVTSWIIQHVARRQDEPEEYEALEVEEVYAIRTIWGKKRVVPALEDKVGGAS